MTITTEPIFAQAIGHQAFMTNVGWDAMAFFSYPTNMGAVADELRGARSES